MHEFDLGYVFYPPKDPLEPGHPRLDIVLRPEPTHRHFDPEKVFFNAVFPDEGVQDLELSYPWLGQKKYQVYPGRVWMKDRKSTTKEAFTFGAGMEIDHNDERTLCILTSEAPILELILQRSVAVALAEEVEIILAELRGVWAKNLDELEKRLSSAGPIPLYAACLDTLRKKFKGRENLEDEQTRELVHFLNVKNLTLAEMQRTFPESLQLAELFSPLAS